MTSTFQPLPEIPKSTSACLAQTTPVGPPSSRYGPDWSFNTPSRIVGVCARAGKTGITAAAGAAPSRDRRVKRMDMFLLLGDSVTKEKKATPPPLEGGGVFSRQSPSQTGVNIGIGGPPSLGTNFNVTSCPIFNPPNSQSTIFVIIDGPSASVT